MSPQRWTLGAKVALVVTLQALMLVALGALSAWIAHRTDQDLRFAQSARVHGQNAAGAMVAMANLEAQAALLVADDGDARALETEVARLGSAIIAMLEGSREQVELLGDDDPDEEREAAEERQARATAALALRVSQDARALAGAPSSELALRTGALRAEMERLHERLAEASQDEEEEVRELGAEMLARASGLRSTALVLCAAALAVSCAGWLFLVRTVLGPVRRLRAATQAVADGRLEDRIAVDSSDELGDLARSFNAMSDSLAAQRDDLQRAQQRASLSREAGMAEVANCVLHNVGNLLNSLCASVTRGAQVLGAMDIATLTAVAELVKSRRADLGAFLTQDERGRQLPRLLELLSERLGAQRAEVAGEVERLRVLIDQVTKIVSAQQSYARGSSLIETVDVARLIEDAIQIGVGSHREREIQVVRQLGERLEVRLDGHKLVQVLVNLLKNAKEALAARQEGKRIVVKGSTLPDGRLRVEIADNGVGITAAVRPHLFQHGYSTKASGSGFGLHASALAVEEMGGTIRVESEGAGQGALFVVEIPPGAEERASNLARRAA